MSKSPEEIAADMVVAWLTRCGLATDEAGETIAEVYTKVLRAVQDGSSLCKISYTPDTR